MKKAYFFLVVLSLLLLTGCSKEAVKEEQKEFNVPEFQDIHFNGNYYCRINWSEATSSIEQHERYRVYVEDWILNSFEYYDFAFNKSTEDMEKCINTQEDTTCLLLYGVINNKPEVCEYFPDERIVAFFSPPSAHTGGRDEDNWFNQTCRYKEMCEAFIRIHNGQ